MGNSIIQYIFSGFKKCTFPCKKLKQQKSPQQILTVKPEVEKLIDEGQIITENYLSSIFPIITPSLDHYYERFVSGKEFQEKAVCEEENS